MKTKPTKITFEIIAKIGDKIMVRNYRKKHDQWEEGEVVDINATVGRYNNDVCVTYTVLLSRTIWNRRGWEDYIRLTVGADDIQPLPF